MCPVWQVKLATFNALRKSSEETLNATLGLFEWIKHWLEISSANTHNIIIIHAQRGFYVVDQVQLTVDRPKSDPRSESSS